MYVIFDEIFTTIDLSGNRNKNKTRNKDKRRRRAVYRVYREDSHTCMLISSLFKYISGADDAVFEVRCMIFARAAGTGRRSRRGRKTEKLLSMTGNGAKNFVDGGTSR